MNLSEIIVNNTKFKNEIENMDYKIALLSNIIVSPAKNIIEYFLRLKNINADVTIGNYNNIIQDTTQLNNFDATLIFWELANIVDGLQYKADNMNEVDISLFLDQTKKDIFYVLNNLQSTPLVLFNKFSTLVFNSSFLRENKFDLICKELNVFLEKQSFPNLILIDINKIISSIGITKSIDLRYFYSSKSLYSIEFYKAYSLFILPTMLSIKGKSKKALILDCDNTLWKGILGEDGSENIKMSSKSFEGIVFEEVQNIALTLAKQGVIIGLCSKNNFADIQKVLETHPDITLKDEFIIIKKINWLDKASNIRAISKELNIGLDSIVFIDDSDFEIELIKDQLPTVTVIHVPKKLSQYPSLLREAFSLFFNLSTSSDDYKRLQDYKNQTKREEEKDNFSNIEEYLKSLQIEIYLFQNNTKHIPRIAQLTQKTNQFNLTTKRYTEIDIHEFMKKGLVLSAEVKDKFGENGLTAVLIVTFENEIAIINSFLMSCRIIGRNIEFSIFDNLINILTDAGIKICKAKYIKTIKNEQVSNFYDNLGFSSLDSTSEYKEYKLAIDKYSFKNITYIRMENGTDNQSNYGKNF